MERWTAFVIAHRKRILAVWGIVFVLGGYAAANLGGLLSNRFSVPGSDAERGLQLTKDRFGERGDGDFSLVFRTTAGSVRDPAFRSAAAAAARRAASAVKGAKPGPLILATPRVA